MCRSSRLGRCASLRTPGERQNGEPKAGDYNAPQRRGPRDLQIGPFDPADVRLGSFAAAARPRGELRSPVLQVQSSGAFTRWSARNRRRWRGSRCYCPSPRHPIGHDRDNCQDDRVFRYCLGRPARRSRTFRNAFVNRSIFLSSLTLPFSSFSSMLTGELASLLLYL
jgi:hypothetical protein